jgi:hypothetical protein
MSKSEAVAAGANSDEKLGGALERLINALSRDDAAISDEALTEILTHAARCYVQRLQKGDYFGPFHPGTEITATEAMILSTEVLKSADLQLFELGMWQAMGSPI